MTNRFSQIKWWRVILTALVVYLLSFLFVLITVTGYATLLAFQARGAPDQVMIQAFANQYAPWIGPICLILFTILGAMHVARRVEAAQINGIALGTLVALVNMIFEGMRAFGLELLLTSALTIAAGWLGSRPVSRN